MNEERRKDYPMIQERLARIEERQVAIDRRINGSIDDIRLHISNGSKWRGTILSVCVVIILQFIGFAYMYGSLNKTVAVNEGIVLRLLDKELKTQIQEAK